MLTYNGFMKTILMVCCFFTFSCKNSGSTPNQVANKGLSKMNEASIPNNDTLTIDTKATGWAGVYRGELPCADCAGIQTEIKLKRNGSFAAKMNYEGKDAGTFNEEGKIIWKAGDIIELNTGKGQTHKYLVKKDQLVQLDLSGNRIKGKGADDYILQKD